MKQKKKKRQINSGIKKRRKIKRLMRKGREASLRVNKKIHKRIEELKEDKEFMALLEKEEKTLLTRDDYDEYINKCWSLLKDRIG